MARGESVTFSVTVPLEVVVELSARQAEAKASRSEMVREALTSYLAGSKAVASC